MGGDGPSSVGCPAERSFRRGETRVTDDALVAAFEAGTLSPADFHHRDHVRLAWLILRQAPLLEALARFSLGLKAFAARVGKPGLYHETITWAYLLLIHQRMQSSTALAFEEFAEGNPDLVAPALSALGRYYEEATLGSDLARRIFMMPDALKEPPSL